MAASRRALVVDTSLRIVGIVDRDAAGGADSVEIDVERVVHLDVESVLAASENGRHLDEMAIDAVDSWADEQRVAEFLKCGTTSAWWAMRDSTIVVMKQVLGLLTVVRGCASAGRIDEVLLLGSLGGIEDTLTAACKSLGIESGHAVLLQGQRSSSEGSLHRRRHFLRLATSMKDARGVGEQLAAFAKAPCGVLAFLPDATRTVRTNDGERRTLDPWAGPLIEELTTDGETLLQVSIPHRTRPQHDWMPGRIPYEALTLRALFSPRMLVGFARALRLWTKLIGWRRRGGTASSVDFDGVALASSIREVVTRQGRTRVLELPIFLAVASFLLARCRPAVVVVYGEASRTVRALIVEAQRRGIPTVALQHAHFAEGHRTYRFPPDALSQGLPLCDKTLVFGEMYRSILVDKCAHSEDEVVVTGLGRHDYYRGTDWGRVRNEVRSSLQLGEDDVLCLYTGVTDDPLLVGALEDLLDIAPGVNLAFKLHPTPDPRLHEMTFVQSASSGKRVYLIRDDAFDLYELFAATDLHIDCFSTALLESRLLDVPAVSIDRPSSSVFQRAEWLAADIVPVEALVDWVRDWLGSRSEGERNRPQDMPVASVFRMPAEGVGQAQAAEVMKLARSSSRQEV